MVIFESGEYPDIFDGTGTVGITPEPDSLLLLSTGVLMITAGLFVKRQRSLLRNRQEVAPNQEQD